MFVHSRLQHQVVSIKLPRSVVRLRNMLGSVWLMVMMLILMMILIMIMIMMSIIVITLVDVTSGLDNDDTTNNYDDYDNDDANYNDNNF